MSDFLPAKRKKCKEVSIEDLPDEVLHEIFTLLDNRSLKRCSAVNKRYFLFNSIFKHEPVNLIIDLHRFSQIIDNSSVLMNKFKLKIERMDIRWNIMEILEILSLKRKVQNIELIGLQTSCHNGLIKIFKHLGPNLREVELAYSKIDDFTLREILKYSGTLETLTLKEVSIAKKLPAINPVSMRSLKNLKINHSDWIIIKFITHTAQLASFQVKSYLDEGSNKSNLISFLAQQRKLKKLSLFGTSSRTLFQKDDIVITCNYTLQELFLDHDFGKHSENVNRNIVAFMDFHACSLKNVSISGPHCEKINTFAIANLQELTSLSIDTRGLPKDDDLNDLTDFKPNRTLKFLKLYGFFLSPKVIMMVVKKFPSIEKLELNEWGNGLASLNLLKFVATSCLQLKELTTSEVPPDNTKFPSLQNLSVKIIPNAANFLQFVTRNNSIKKLSVNVANKEQVTLHFIEGLKQLEHLKHLTFFGSSNVIKTIFELVKQGTPPKGLKDLQLHISPDIPEISLIDWKIIKFYFPISASTKIPI